MKIPRDENGNLVCYWHYPGDGPRVLIPGCYGSLYDRPDYCNCPGGVFDPGKVLIKTKTIAKLEKQISLQRSKRASTISTRTQEPTSKPKNYPHYL